jgi:hypothetical protein
MNCPKCQNQNGVKSKFCISCGAPLPQLDYSNLENIKSLVISGANEKQILISVIITFVLQSISFFFYNIFQLGNKFEWGSKEYEIAGIFTSFLFLGAQILLPLALKNNTYRIIGIFLVLLTHMTFIIRNAYNLFN